MGLSLERIFSELPSVPFKDEVWPKFLRENALRVPRREGARTRWLAILSCGIVPGPQAPETAALAEELGYHRAWFYDSPALYGDVWVAIARALDRTERIGVGTAVLVPSLRHVVTTAAAIGTIEAQAPGRLAVAIGTGFTGRAMLGKPALSLKAAARVRDGAARAACAARRRSSTAPRAGS